MDIIIIVVVIGALIGMVVMMFRYAGFVHRFPSQHDQDEKQCEDEMDHPFNNKNE